MGRHRLANLKEIDKQSNKQFVPVPNDNDILAEIIRELTKTEEGSEVASE